MFFSQPALTLFLNSITINFTLLLLIFRIRTRCNGGSASLRQLSEGIVFSKNCMKMKEIGPRGEKRGPIAINRPL